MNYTAILLDDEYTSSEVLEYELKKLDIDIKILGIYEDSIEGVKAIRKENPDLVFLDIEMPNLNGFEVLDLLGEDHNVKVIFVTAYNNYAVDAFQYYAVDYLVKPVSFDRLSIAVSKAISNSAKIPPADIEDLSKIIENEVTETTKIVVPISSGFQMIKINNIVKCVSDNNYTNIHLENNSDILVSKSLIHFEKILSRVNFLRVHQSHLVNMKYVNQYIKSDGGYLVLHDNSQVPISRNQKSKVTEYFKKISI